MEQTANCFIARLPNEILQTIFGYLSLESVVTYAVAQDPHPVVQEPQVFVLANVCRQFRTVATEAPF